MQIGRDTDQVMWSIPLRSRLAERNPAMQGFNFHDMSVTASSPGSFMPQHIIVLASATSDSGNSQQVHASPAIMHALISDRLPGSHVRPSQTLFVIFRKMIK